MFLFFGVFLGLGLILTCPFLIHPLWKQRAAQDWPRMPCTIVSSEVKRHSGGDSTTYGIHIVYRYHFNNRMFQSDRYDFITGSSSGFKSKKMAVDAHPPGSQRVCYVNPVNPSEAVLRRDLHAGYLAGIIPVVFTVVGAAGLFVVRRNKLNVGAGGSNKIFGLGAPPNPGSLPPHSALPAILAPKNSPLKKFIFFFVFAVIWNIVIFIFASQLLQGWQKGAVDWSLALFFIPFFLAGIVLPGIAFYHLLALANPRPRLGVSSQCVPLGGSFTLRWEFSGRTSRIRRLHIRLAGQEEATYQRGTSTITDKAIFATLNIFDTTNPLEMTSGQATVVVPSSSMHSFASSNNKIVWFIQLHGEINWWPDIKEEFEIVVLPLEAAQ
ncbi:MAG: DUF3592 domain-containing protein [Verrucomicrobiae bacterium]|nr:DUF3592 domain-containing protein [Verrucomicrobiae bacterium]